MDGWKRVKAAIGIGFPLVDLTYTCFSPSGLCQKTGSTSITTKYWFIGLKVRAISRSPKASYKTLSSVCGVTPMRAAVGRSITRFASGPLFC